MLTRNDLQSCANLSQKCRYLFSPANLCAASSASDLPTWVVTTYPSCDLNTTIEAAEDHTGQDTSVCYVYICTYMYSVYQLINLILFVQSLTNQGDFHASEWFLSSSVLSSHLSASDLPGSCSLHLRWYRIDSFLLIMHATCYKWRKQASENATH